MKINLSIISVFVFLFSFNTVNAGTITEITSGDFSTPNILDFESATPGAISGTDSLFTDVGIAQISAIGTNFSDALGSRNNVSRSLWFNDSGLQIVDAGDSGMASYFISYTIEFTNYINKFGWGWHDQEDEMKIDFFNGVTTVGSFLSVGNLVSGSSDIDDFRTLFLMNTDAFDKIVITNNTGFGGFSIDDLTLETSAVPEPTTMLLFGTGIAGLAAVGRRRRK